MAPPFNIGSGQAKPRMVVPTGQGIATTSLTSFYRYADPVGSASRAQLMDHFLFSLATLLSTRERAIDPDLVVASAGMVQTLLSDDAPTPQVSSGPEGGIAVEWLVGGTSLTIHFVSVSDIRLWADAPDGSEIFSYELNANWSPSDQGIGQARKLLTQLGGGLTNRLSLKSGFKMTRAW